MRMFTLQIPIIRVLSQQFLNFGNIKASFYDFPQFINTREIYGTKKLLSLLRNTANGCLTKNKYSKTT